MNIYLINPKYMNPDAFKVFIKILKVKEIYNFIVGKDYPSELMDTCNNLCTINAQESQSKDIFKNAVYYFLKDISKPIIVNGEWTGDCKVEDKFSKSLSMNPIYNVERLDDPNILILTPKAVEDNPSTHCRKRFIHYIFNILDKYGKKYKYEDRICVYNFDRFLYRSFIGFGHDIRDGVEYIHKDQHYYKLAISGSHDPLLSYIHLKSNNLLNGDTLQERFLIEEGRTSFINYLAKLYESNRYSGSCTIDVNPGGDWESEYNDIIQNGGDWILDN